MLSLANIQEKSGEYQEAQILFGNIESDGLLLSGKFSGFRREESNALSALTDSWTDRRQTGVWLFRDTSLIRDLDLENQEPIVSKH